MAFRAVVRFSRWRAPGSHRWLTGVWNVHVGKDGDRLKVDVERAEEVGRDNGVLHAHDETLVEHHPCERVRHARAVRGLGLRAEEEEEVAHRSVTLQPGIDCGPQAHESEHLGAVAREERGVKVGMRVGPREWRFVA